MVKSVCRNFQWASPDVIDRMFMDAKDHHGLLYWYNDVDTERKRIEALTPKK